MGHKDPADEAQELRELIRDMHACLKDGQRLLKAMETVKQELLSAAQEVFDERMEGQVEKTLSAFSAVVETQIENATEAVYNRFDTIADVLTGKGTDFDLNKAHVLVIGDPADGSPQYAAIMEPKP